MGFFFIFLLLVGSHILAFLIVFNECPTCILINAYSLKDTTKIGCRTFNKTLYKFFVIASYSHSVCVRLSFSILFFTFGWYLICCFMCFGCRVEYANRVSTSIAPDETQVSLHSMKRKVCSTSAGGNATIIYTVDLTHIMIVLLLVCCLFLYEILSFSLRLFYIVLRLVSHSFLPFGLSLNNINLVVVVVFFVERFQSCSLLPFKPSPNIWKKQKLCLLFCVFIFQRFSLWYRYTGTCTCYVHHRLKTRLFYWYWMCTVEVYGLCV